MTYTKEEIDAAYTACILNIPNERWLREVAEEMFALMTMREATQTLKIWVAHSERAQQLSAHDLPRLTETRVERLRRLTALLQPIGEA